MNMPQKLLVWGLVLAGVAFVARVLLGAAYDTSWSPPALLIALAMAGLALAVLVGLVLFLVGLLVTTVEAVRHRQR